MSESWRAPGGWRVTIVHLQNTPDKSDGPRYRITQYGAFTADVRSPAEVARFVPLELLEEDEGLLAA